MRICLQKFESRWQPFKTGKIHNSKKDYTYDLEKYFITMQSKCELDIYTTYLTCMEFDNYEFVIK